MKKLQIFFSLIIFTITGISYSLEFNEDRFGDMIVEPVFINNKVEIKNLSNNYNAIKNEIEILRRHCNLQLHPSIIYNEIVSSSVKLSAEFNYLDIKSSLNEHRTEGENLSLSILGTLKSPTRETIKILKEIKELEKEKLSFEIKSLILKDINSLCQSLVYFHSNKCIRRIYQHAVVSLDSLINDLDNFRKAGILSMQDIGSLKILRKKIALDKELFLSDSKILKLGILNDLNLTNEIIDSIEVMIPGLINQIENVIVETPSFKDNKLKKNIDSLHNLINIKYQKKQYVSNSKLQVGPFLKKHTKNKNYEVGIGVNFLFGKRSRAFTNKDLTSEVESIGDEIIAIKEAVDNNRVEREKYIKELRLGLTAVLKQVKLGHVQSLYLLSDYLNRILEQEVNICKINESYKLLLLNYLNELKLFKNSNLERYIHND